MKAAIALHQAQRRSEFEQVRSDLSERYAGEKVTLGGQTSLAPGAARVLKDQAATEIAARPESKPGSEPAEANLVLSDSVEPVWQMRFGDTVEAGMTPAELTQWEGNALSATIPAVAVVDGSKLFANYLGYLFAMDLKSGKLLWRSAAFHHVEVPAMQNVAQMTDTTRYTILASGEYVWTLARDEGRQLSGRRSVLTVLPRGERRSRLAIERPFGLRRARLERSAVTARRARSSCRRRDRAILSRAREACSSSCWRFSRTTAR